MKELNVMLDMLIMEGYTVYQDMNAMKTVLEACPHCSVERADVVDALAAAAGYMIDAMAKLRAVKEYEGEDGTVQNVGGGVGSHASIDRPDLRG